MHYNSLSGRWKLFDNEVQEQSFKVRGGMQWYGSTLIVTAEERDEQGLPVYTVGASLASTRLEANDPIGSFGCLAEIGRSTLLTR